MKRAQERLFGVLEKKGPTVASLRIVRDCADAIGLKSAKS